VGAVSAESGGPITFDDRAAFQRLCGPHDANLKTLAGCLQVSCHARGNSIVIEGDELDTEVALRAVAQLYELATDGYELFPSDIRRASSIVASGARLVDVLLDEVLITSGKRRIAPKNLSQKRYVDAMRSHDLSFGIGPAGTGKTYLAMAMAVSALLSKEVGRIVLTRPAVEAGERLGFLPGDMSEKVNPYLRPLFDALHEMLDLRRVQQMLEDNTIEIAPLAFMRGRTLSDAFVILDEAQNTTREQMKMFLTRIGPNTKAVVTGDITQTDLPDPSRCGLLHARSILADVKGVAICTFRPEDVVRHHLVARIVQAYERDFQTRLEGRS
jgi:phosphate starvation-inducible protein PhoH and related proteins